MDTCIPLTGLVVSPVCVYAQCIQCVHGTHAAFLYINSISVKLFKSSVADVPITQQCAHQHRRQKTVNS